MDAVEEKKLGELLGGQTFRLLTPADMFRKLHREKERYRDNVLSRENRTDAALNFSWTAWHLLEWFWTQNRAEIEQLYGVQDFAGFKGAAIERCSELRVFDVIANAAKHGGRAHAYPNRPDINTLLIFEPDANTANDAIELVSAELPEHKWHLAVVINGKENPLYVLMDAVFRFWFRTHLAVMKKQMKMPAEQFVSGADKLSV